MRKPSKAFVAAIIVLAALIFHCWVQHFVFDGSDGFAKYPDFARQYIQNKINPERIVDFSPLYLHIHIAVQKYLQHPQETMLCMQLLAVSGSAGLLFLLLEPFVGVCIAAISGIVFITSRSLILYAGVFEPEAFLVFFLMCFLICVRQKSNAMAFCAGFFLGLCLLLRMNFFPLVLLTPLYFFINQKDRKNPAQRIIVFFAPALFAMILPAINNFSHTGVFSPVVMNPGTVFFEGNNPNANGRCAVYPPMIDRTSDDFTTEVDAPHSVYRLFSRRITQEDLSVPEVNSYWAGKALAFISDNPVFWCSSLASKALCIFHNARWHDIGAVIANDGKLRESNIPAIPFGIISAMALIGMAISIKNWKKLFIIYSVVACQMSVMLITYASDRQRVSILALFVFFAAIIVFELVNKKQSLKNKGLIAAGFIIFAIIFILPNDRMKDCRYFVLHSEQTRKLIREAGKCRDEGKLIEASQKNVLAYALTPFLTESRLFGLKFKDDSYSGQAVCTAESLYSNKNDCSSRFDLAVMYLENKSPDKAERIINELSRKRCFFSRLSAQSSHLCFYRACILERKGLLTEAKGELKKVLDCNPGDPWALSHLAVITGDSKYESRLIRYFDEVDAAFFIGQAALELGRFDESTRRFAYIVSTIPEYRDGRIYLSISLAGRGEYQAAASMYIDAMKQKGEPLFFEKETLAMFRQYAALSPDNFEAIYYMGMVEKGFGHYDEALSIFQPLLNKNPSMQMVNEHIEWIDNAKRQYGFEK